MAKKEVNFSIEGAFIADLARTRLKEGEYQSALNILECLDGLSIEEQINILLGKKTLQGVNDIELVDAPKELMDEMTQWHKDKYGQIFSYHGKLYIPYAYVDSWCREDLPTDEDSYSSVSYNIINDYEGKKLDKTNIQKNMNYLKGHLHSRSLHYAENPSKDFALTVNQNDIPSKDWDGAVVLFKSVEEQIPFWAKNFYAKTPYGAVAVAFENRRLERTGGRYYYDNYVEATDKINASYSPIPKTQEEKYEEQAQRYERELESYKNEVIEFANNDKEYGWKEFQDEEGNNIKVPYRAFLHYAVDFARHNNKLDVEIPPYTPKFRSGFKMLNDNPYHTDAWVGSGLDIDKAYDSDTWEHKLFMRKMFELQYCFFNEYQFNIITTGKKSSIQGTTVNISNYESVPKGERILVIPHLGVEFETVALQCDAIITETGGKLAHLATVGRELNIPIIRIENAVIQFALPHTFKFDLEEGKYEKISENMVQRKLKP